MYDQRMKAQRDYQWVMESAREEARTEGLAEGPEQGLVIGSIQTLQKLLGDPVKITSVLASYAPEKLESLHLALQNRVRNVT